DELCELVQPFHQLSLAQAREFDGTGLGLAISQRLAEKLGGTIRVQSTPGAGSTFTLTLPTGPWDGQPHLEPAIAASTLAAPEPALSTRPPKLACRILLAEDNRDNQRVISLRLTLAGADVTLAQNGRVAIELALAARE